MLRRSSPPRARDCISPDGWIVEVVVAIHWRTRGLVSPARRRADQLPFCAAVAYAAHPLLGHGAISFPVVAKGGVERYGGVANSLSGPPSPGQLALPAALGTRRSPCRRPSRDAQTEDLRSPTSTGLGRGVAAPFARRRPNRGGAHWARTGLRSSTADADCFRTLAYGSNLKKCERRTGRDATASDTLGQRLSPYADRE